MGISSFRCRALIFAKPLLILSLIPISCFQVFSEIFHEMQPELLEECRQSTRYEKISGVYHWNEIEFLCFVCIFISPTPILPTSIFCRICSTELWIYNIYIYTCTCSSYFLVAFFVCPSTKSSRYTVHVYSETTRCLSWQCLPGEIAVSGQTSPNKMFTLYMLSIDVIFCMQFSIQSIILLNYEPSLLFILISILSFIESSLNVSSGTWCWYFLNLTTATIVYDCGNTLDHLMIPLNKRLLHRK